MPSGANKAVKALTGTAPDAPRRRQTITKQRSTVGLPTPSVGPSEVTRQTSVARGFARFCSALPTSRRLGLDCSITELRRNAAARTRTKRSGG